MRFATTSDADHIARIHARSWFAGFSPLYGETVAWAAVEQRCSPQRWSQRLQEGARVIVTDSGFVQFDGNEIERLYVLPEAWGTGLARRLLDTAVAEMTPPITVWSAETEQALGFYRKAGFVASGLCRVEQLAPGVVATDYELVCAEVSVTGGS